MVLYFYNVGLLGETSPKANRVTHTGYTLRGRAYARNSRMSLWHEIQVTGGIHRWRERQVSVSRQLAAVMECIMWSASLAGLVA